MISFAQFNQRWSQKIFWILLWAITAIGIGLHLQAVWHQQLFGDEVHSLFFFGSHSWLELLQSPIEPVHPNGYYLLLKAWYFFTPSVIALRWWQFLVFLATALSFALVAKQLRFKSEMILLAVALWTSSAYVWHFSFQLRMYGVGMLLVLLSLLLVWKKKPWLSALIDWLCISMVYGAVVFVIAKWSAYFILQHSANKKNWKQDLLVSALGVFPVLLVAWQFLQQQTHIDTNFLYWVHVPQIEDWSLGLVSMMTGLFLPYFEGFSTLSPFWQELGLLANLGILVGVLGVSALGIWKRKLLLQWWKTLHSSEKFLVLLAFILLGIYTVLFVSSLLLDGHLFHIRQLFSIAVILILVLSWKLNILWKYSPLLCMGIALAFIGVNLLGVARDSFGLNQTYPHHFTELPGKPVVATVSDVELIYKQCHTFEKTQTTDSCNLQDIYLIDSQWSPPQEWPRWWMTLRAYEQNKTLVDQCVPVGIDFWECQL